MKIFLIFIALLVIVFISFNINDWIEKKPQQIVEIKNNSFHDLNNSLNYDCSFDYYAGEFQDSVGGKIVINPELYPYLNDKGGILITDEFLDKFCKKR